MIREAVKDRSYRATPVGLEVARYYRWKRNEWGATASTLRDYEAILARLAIDHADLTLADFEPPVGTERIREFWDRHWAERTPRTRAKVLSVIRDFFAWAVRERGLQGNPTLAIQAPKRRGVERTVFSRQIVQRIIAGQSLLSDRLACRLILESALRKAELAAVRFKHFDLERQRLTVFGKGGKVRSVPIVDRHFWRDLGVLQLERMPEPDHYLLPKPPMTRRVGSWPDYRFAVVREFPDQPISATSMHRWWYARLVEAGVISDGTTSGEGMHRGRHTALTDLTRFPGANLKHVQLFAGHASEATTADIYAHLDDVDLELVLRAMYEGRDGD
jgi:integrase